jgi:arylsulfatase A-like enzyme
MYAPEETSILPGWTDECFERDLAFNRGYFPHADLTRKIVRRATAYYYAAISQIDYHVGRMIRLLQEKGLYDKTMIVFTSDHGEYLGFHHLLLKGNHMYDPLAKVPLVVKYPHGESRGASCRELVSNVDLAPTILGVCGIAPHDRMRGLDLATNPGGRDVVFCEYGRGGTVMARTKSRKLLAFGTKERASRLFFDLENDPLEMNDLSADPARLAEVGRLADAIKAWRPADRIEPPYLDEDAPQIDRPNVPSRDRSHRPEIIEYYKRMMERSAGQGEP